MLLNLLYFCVLGESGLLLWKLDDNGKMTNYAKLHDWKFGSSTWVIDKGYIFEKIQRMFLTFIVKELKEVLRSSCASNDLHEKVKGGMW